MASLVFSVASCRHQCLPHALFQCLHVIGKERHFHMMRHLRWEWAVFTEQLFSDLLALYCILKHFTLSLSMYLFRVCIYVPLPAHVLSCHAGRGQKTMCIIHQHFWPHLCLLSSLAFPVKSEASTQTGSCAPVIPALGWPRQENHEFVASLCYIVNSRPAWAIVGGCLGK